MLAAVLSLNEVLDNFGSSWPIYASMPIIGALVGYGTKVVAVQMLYKPLRFVGFGPIGWQGVIPRRAGKVAAVTIEMMTERLLNPHELLERIDAEEAVEELREPLTRIAHELGRDVLEAVRPGLWSNLPEPVRRQLISRVNRAAPRVVEGILRDVREDMPRYLDLQYMAVTTLVRNKAQLNRLMQGLGSGATSFLRRSGIYFGLILGTAQMLAWAFFQNPWIMPAFGFFIGFASDWLALNLIFVPRRRTRILGVFPFQGVLHADRATITRDYARVLAQDLFSVDTLLDAVMHGPAAEKMWWSMEREILAALKREAGIAAPVSAALVGGRRFDLAKQRIVQSILVRVPEVMDEARGYATRTLNLEELIAEKMAQLDDHEYESILRPIFKDDEMLIIMVGAVLGFLVGEVQLLMVEHFTH